MLYPSTTVLTVWSFLLLHSNTHLFSPQLRPHTPRSQVFIDSQCLVSLIFIHSLGLIQSDINIRLCSRIRFFLKFRLNILRLVFVTCKEPHRVSLSSHMRQLLLNSISSTLVLKINLNEQEHAVLDPLGQWYVVSFNFVVTIYLWDLFTYNYLSVRFVCIYYTTEFIERSNPGLWCVLQQVFKQ